MRWPVFGSTVTLCERVRQRQMEGLAVGSAAVRELFTGTKHVNRPNGRACVEGEQEQAVRMRDSGGVEEVRLARRDDAG